MYKFFLSTPTQLLELEGDDAVLGWEDTTIRLERIEEYDGFFGDYAIDLEFQGRAFEEILKTFETDGTEAEAYLLVKYACDGLNYVDLYRGRLDFYTIEFDLGLCICTCDIKDQGLARAFLANVDKPYDLMLHDEDDWIKDFITAPGKTLTQEALWRLLFEKTVFYEIVKRYGANFIKQLPENTGIGFGNEMTWSVWQRNSPQFQLNANKFATAFNSGFYTQDIVGLFQETPFIPQEFAVYSGAVPTTGEICINIDAEVSFLIANVVNSAVSGNLSFSAYIKNNTTLDIRHILVVRDSANNDTISTIGTDTYNITPQRVFPQYAAEGALPDKATMIALLEAPDTAVVTFPVSLNYTASIPLNPQDRLFYYFEYEFKVAGTPQGDAGGQEFQWRYRGISKVTTFDGNSASLSAPVTEAPGDFRAFRLYEAGQIIVQNTIAQTSLYSETIGANDATIGIPTTNDGNYANLAITNGLLLRNIVSTEDGGDCSVVTSISNTELVLSFQDYFDNLRNILCMGAEVSEVNGSEVVRIEHLDYFYRNSPSSFVFPVIDPQATSFKLTVDESRCFSVFKYGYETWVTEGINGLDEWASTRSYRTYISNRSNLERLSTFIASGYALETQRLTPRTADNAEFDDDVFIVALARNSLVSCQILKSLELGGPISGTISPATSYNWRLRPGAIAYRWSFYDAVPPSGDTWFYAGGEGNTLPENDPTWSGYDCGQPQNLPVKENDGIFTSARLSVVNVSFELPLTFDDYLQIKENKYNLFRVSIGCGNYIKFWLTSIEFRITGKSKVTGIKAN